MKQYIALQGLMDALHITKWPESWNHLYTEVFWSDDAGIRKLTDEQYYRKLHEKYGCFEKELTVFCKAACAAEKIKPLRLYLALAGEAVLDREQIKKDIAMIEFPEPPEGCDPESDEALAYRMSSGMVMAAVIPYADSLMMKRNLPKEIRSRVLCQIEGSVNEYRRRHNGLAGYNHFSWNQYVADALLFPIGRLVIGLGCRFYANGIVYTDGGGNDIVLADQAEVLEDGFLKGTAGHLSSQTVRCAEVTENDAAYCGFPVERDGRISNTPITLSKDIWAPKLASGDPVVFLHIPPIRDFSPSVIDDTLQEIREFLNQYYPEYVGKQFACGSWLLCPELEGLIGSESNIVKFGKRFRVLPTRSSGTAVFYFAFLCAESKMPDLNTLPESTTLLRRVKAYYQGGHAVRETTGYLI